MGTAGLWPDWWTLPASFPPGTSDRRSASERCDTVLYKIETIAAGNTGAISLSYGRNCLDNRLLVDKIGQFVSFKERLYGVAKPHGIPYTKLTDGPGGRTKSRKRDVEMCQPSKKRST